MNNVQLFRYQSVCAYENLEMTTTDVNIVVTVRYNNIIHAMPWSMTATPLDVGGCAETLLILILWRLRLRLCVMTSWE